jgi:serine/threonine protein kinase/tetratricopeptide (TPR) repeat protein
MTPERWQQVMNILGPILEALPEERATLLERLCGDDIELREEVAALVIAFEKDPGWLEKALLPDNETLLMQPAKSPMEGQLLGPYKIIRELGRGGMGAVYLAVRSDDQYRKRVAIKLIKRGLDTEEILSRFRHERQILASLDHPNIARLLHGDTTTDGLSYFVMEYVEGVPIDSYCDTKRLSTATRLELFRKVCAAVHYAHQNLVVHRDLKPGNILVTDEGEPKLLDFGIAKLLNPELYGQTIAPTEIAVRLMTPDYASPEQVRGGKITTASDVYSLGVLLYELLTGHRPYQLKGTERVELERVICEESPAKPSLVINRREDVIDNAGETRILTPESVSKTREGEPDKLRRRLEGDLDNIVLMAMRKEPERRYLSVGHFAEDIRRHLEGLPVSARRDTFSYRTGKFVKRNKVGVAIATAFAVLLAVSAVLIIRQSARTAHERDKAERVSAFLVDLFKVSDPSEAKGKSITAREILDQGAARIETEMKDQPEVQASLMDAIGMVYRGLGLYDSAIPLLEKSVKLRREVLGNENVDTAKSLNDLGWVLLEKQRSKEAEPFLQEAIKIRRKLRGEEHQETAESLNLLAFARKDQGDIVSAETLYRETLALRKKIFGPMHRDVAQSLNNLALMATEKGDFTEADKLYQEALAIDRQTVGMEDPDVLTHLSNYALLKDNQGEYDAAQVLYREIIVNKRKVLGNEHPSLAVTLNNLAENLRQKGDYENAEPFYREAQAIFTKQLGEDNPNVATLTQNLGRMFYDKGNLTAAEPLYRKALVAYRKQLSEEDPRVARTVSNMGQLTYERGDFAAAEPQLRQALQTQRKLYPNGHKDLATTLVGLGRLLTDTNRAGEAESLLREGLEIRRAKQPAGNYQIAEAQSALGGALSALNRFDEAEPLLMEAYETLEARRGDKNKLTTQARERLYVLYKAWGKTEKAAQFH